MNIERYNDLLGNKPVLKMGGMIGIEYFKDSQNEIAIEFVFKHSGNLNNESYPSAKRARINVFQLKNLNSEVNAHPIKDNVLVMVNSDIPGYALTYELKINEKEKRVEFKLVDAPEIGEIFVTNEELKGFFIQY